MHRCLTSYKLYNFKKKKKKPKKMLFAYLFLYLNVVFFYNETGIKQQVIENGKKNLIFSVQFFVSLTYHKCFHQNHLYNPFHRYRRDHVQYSYHPRKPGNHLDTRVRRCATRVLHDVPCSWIYSSLQLLSSHKFVSQYRNTNRQDSEWLEDPKFKRKN